MLYISTIFIGAFLLFQVQPLIAKILLPFFGGGASVWTACLLFFQGALFVGYLYAHLITQISQVRIQAIIHMSLLWLSLCLMPSSMVVSSQYVIEHSGELSPLLAITLLLANTIGLPYLLLSATGPLLQRWLSYENTKKTPYKLYAVSNLASLLALLSYPFFIEPLLAVSEQGTIWKISYWLFVVVISLIGFKHYKKNKLLLDFLPNEVANDGSEEPENKNLVTPKSNQGLSIFLWGLLAAIGVMFLVATTNAMTQNIPPVPFLWILPLSLYLLSFILCFHSPKCYVRWYWFALFALSAFAATLMFFIGTQFTLVSQLVIYSFILMSACMLCHGELARLKPAVNKLTLYYLMLSLGGFLGSLFVNLVAPYFFIFFLEFLIAIWALFIAFSLSVYMQKQSVSHLNDGRIDTIMSRISIGLMLVLVAFYVYLNGVVTQNIVASERNFYGLLSVIEVDTNKHKERRLIDGTTSHGTQLLDPELSHIPKSYYRKDTGVALALEHLYEKPDINVGLIGLGAGTLAAYADEDDSYYFYELNPAVETMAKNYFSYLSESKGYIDVSLGDGRVSLTRELEEFGSNEYQVLVVDAFSGDAIPSHLLTVEAFELYWNHLSDNGVLAIHISNSHLDLSELVRGLAQNSGKQALSFITPPTKVDSNEAHWVLITNNKSFINHRKVKSLQTAWPQSENDFTLWTDNYSNLLSVLK